jgi:hypothetical protein
MLPFRYVSIRIPFGWNIESAANIGRWLYLNGEMDKFKDVVITTKTKDMRETM